MTKPLAKKVLLIGWDAADWKVINPLMDQGLMPTLEDFVNHGVMGNIATLRPILSPMLWNSIASGKRADKHGILGFMEPDPRLAGASSYQHLAQGESTVEHLDAARLQGACIGLVRRAPRRTNQRDFCF